VQYCPCPFLIVFRDKCIPAIPRCLPTKRVVQPKDGECQAVRAAHLQEQPRKIDPHGFLDNPQATANRFVYQYRRQQTRQVARARSQIHVGERRGWIVLITSSPSATAASLARN
jgi:hypothetical protein